MSFEMTRSAGEPADFKPIEDKYLDKRPLSKAETKFAERLEAINPFLAKTITQALRLLYRERLWNTDIPLCRIFHQLSKVTDARIDDAWMRFCEDSGSPLTKVRMESDPQGGLIVVPRVWLTDGNEQLTRRFADVSQEAQTNEIMLRGKESSACQQSFLECIARISTCREGGISILTPENLRGVLSLAQENGVTWLIDACEDYAERKLFQRSEVTFTEITLPCGDTCPSGENHILPESVIAVMRDIAIPNKSVRLMNICVVTLMENKEWFSVEHRASLRQLADETGFDLLHILADARANKHLIVTEGNVWDEDSGKLKTFELFRFSGDGKVPHKTEFAIRIVNDHETSDTFGGFIAYLEERATMAPPRSDRPAIGSSWYNDPLTLMIFYGQVFGEREARALAVFLNTNRTLMVLALNSNEIGCETVQTIAKALETHPTVQEVELKGNKIGKKGTQAVAEALKNNGVIRSLNLSKNKIEIDGLRALTAALLFNSTLHFLDLFGNDLGNEGARVLARALSDNESLQRVSLSENNISDEGVEALAAAMASNRGLTHLMLNKNRIGVKGAQALATMLRGESKLAHLELNDCHFGDHCVEALSSSWGTNTTLVHLSLQGNRIGVPGAAHIATGLRVNATLRTLDLKNNKIGDEGVGLIAQALAENRGVSQLNFCSCKIGEKGVELLAQGLQSNQALQQLELSSNAIGKKKENKSLLGLVRVLVKHPVFELLTLLNTPIHRKNQEETERILGEAKEERKGHGFPKIHVVFDMDEFLESVELSVMESQRFISWVGGEQPA